MSLPRGLRRGLAAALLTAAAGTSPAWAETREMDPRQAAAATLAIRSARLRMIQHDADRQKRLAILRAERVEALRLNQRGRADAFALQMQLAQQQGRVQAAQDRESLRREQTALRDAQQGTTVP